MAGYAYTGSWATKAAAAAAAQAKAKATQVTQAVNRAATY